MPVLKKEELIMGPDINQDSVIIENKIYKKSDPYIVKDYFTGEYTHMYLSRTVNILENVSKGVLYLKLERTCVPNYTIFKIVDIYRDIYNVVFKDIKTGKEELKKLNIFPGKFNKNIYYIKGFSDEYDKVKPCYFRNPIKKLTIKDVLSSDLKSKSSFVEYKNIKDNIKKENSKYGIDTYTNLELENKPITFGVEFETISGGFKPEELKDYNIASVFDGSLRKDPFNQIGEPEGAEYVTGVLKGDSGFKHLYKILKKLNTRCSVDKRCALHVHIGSLKWNSEEIVLAYLLGLLLEDEIFSILPKSRKDNIFCKKLPSISFSAYSMIKNMHIKSFYKLGINILYKEIFKIVSGEDIEPNSEYNKDKIHPKGQHGGYNRQRDHRYSWLNFTNIIFNQREDLESKTIEFRAHSGTLNYRKTKNWIKICAAFVEFVHNHKRDIIDAASGKREIYLETIIMLAYPKTGKDLVDYINERKQLFKIESTEDAEYLNDNNFKLKNKRIIRCV